jgi:hypothetical protein
MGLNISKSGVSPSFRTRFGSIGPKGFSIRSGIRGVSYRRRFGKSSDAALLAILLLVFVAILPIVFRLMVIAARLLIIVLVWGARILVIAPCNALLWAFQTLGDYVKYRRLVSQAQQSQSAQLKQTPGSTHKKRLGAP